MQGGDGVDTYAFSSVWGEDTITDDNEDLHDGISNTLDFSDITTDLTFTIHATTPVSVTDGSNALGSLAFMPVEFSENVVDDINGLDRIELVETIIGGSGDDTFVIEDGAVFAGDIDGGNGHNSLDYGDYNGDVDVNFDTGNDRIFRQYR